MLIKKHDSIGSYTWAPNLTHFSAIRAGPIKANSFNKILINKGCCGKAGPGSVTGL